MAATVIRLRVETRQNRRFRYDWPVLSSPLCLSVPAPAGAHLAVGRALALRCHRPHRRGGHGTGLASYRHPAQPPGRAEDPARRLRDGPGSARPVPAGGAGAREPQVQPTMSLSPGTRLGHYDVTALIGEGGMGQVWQATDTQLNRQVALKILPDAFATDPDRLARFQREAQVLASLTPTSRPSTASSSLATLGGWCWSWSRVPRWLTA